MNVMLTASLHLHICIYLGKKQQKTLITYILPKMILGFLVSLEYFVFSPERSQSAKGPKYILCESVQSAWCFMVRRVRIRWLATFSKADGHSKIVVI